jgi:hypothetical protein
VRVDERENLLLSFITAPRTVDRVDSDLLPDILGEVESFLNGEIVVEDVAWFRKVK